MKQGTVGILTGRIRYMSLIRYIWKRSGGGGTGAPTQYIWGKHIPCKENRCFQSPEVESHLGCLRNSKIGQCGEVVEAKVKGKKQSEVLGILESNML